jgi:Ferritin-like domain
MSDIWTLEDVDRDGAIQEAAEQVDPDTRAVFLKKAGIGLGAVAGTSAFMGAMPGLASAAAVPASDVAILNFALTLEYLEAAFYAEAVANKGVFNGETQNFARIVAAHEAAHVTFLKGALGAKAVAKPTFDFKDTTSDQAKFEATATVLEDTGVQAYLGQVGNIKNKKILAAAGSILPVEARHAAWIRDIRLMKTQGTIPAPTAFQSSKTKAQILAAVTSTGFIVA